MKKGISVGLFQTDFGPIVYSGSTPEQWEIIFQKVRAAGYDGVDLFTDEKSVEQMREIKTMLDRNGLDVAMMVSITMASNGVNLSSEDEKIRKLSVEKYCGEICKAAVFAPCSMPVGYVRGNLKDGERMEDNLSRLAISVRELTEYGKTMGVKICVEPMNRYDVNTLPSVKETAEFIRRYNLSGTYILADFYHMNIEDANMEEAIRMNGDLIGHVHCPDSNRAAPGMGHLDYRALIRVLKDVGYQGYLSSESMPFGDSDSCAVKGAQYLDEVMKSCD